MTPDRVEERVDAALRGAPDAEERRAQERAWAVVRGTVPAPAPSAVRRVVRAWRPALTAAALVAVGLGVALAPLGDAVADLLRRAIGEPAAPPPLPVRGAKLPGGGGALLASGRNGPIVVRNAVATDRLLGAVDEASWSPRGRFVVAARGPEVIAVDRSGRRRWTVVAPSRVRHPRWSPDGFRVAYVAARRLRVVAGDGTGDRALARVRPSVPPAWRPRAAQGRHLVAYVDPGGRVVVRDADSGVRVGLSRKRLRVRALAWTGDGTRLLALTASRTIWMTPGGTSTRFISPRRRAAATTRPSRSRPEADCAPRSPSSAPAPRSSSLACPAPPAASRSRRTAAGSRSPPRPQTHGCCSGPARVACSPSAASRTSVGDSAAEAPSASRAGAAPAESGWTSGP